VSFLGGNLEAFGWLVAVFGGAVFLLAAVTVIVLAVRAARRRRSIRAFRHIGYAAGEGLIRPDELKRYGDILRASVKHPDENGHEGKGAA
jgi:hypothetical protein